MRISANAKGEISLAEIIRAVEGPLATVRGSRPEDVQYSGVAASLRESWIELRAALRGILEETTLADVVACAGAEPR